MTANWWDELVPEPPEDTERTRQLGELARWRSSLPVPQIAAAGGPSWEQAVEELEAALADPDQHRWTIALQLTWAVGRLEAVLGLLQNWPVPRSPR